MRREGSDILSGDPDDLAGDSDELRGDPDLVRGDSDVLFDHSDFLRGVSDCFSHASTVLFLTPTIPMSTCVRRGAWRRR
jgi:hypothetical protein